MSLVSLAFLSSACPSSYPPIEPQTTTSTVRVEFDGVSYRALMVDAKNINLILNSKSGERLGTFENARKEATKRFNEVPFGIMNAGIFEPGETPSGLHIENFKTITALNLEDGKGNFFTKPNGVFFVDKSARILTSRAFSQKKRKARIAVQSGPLLMRGKKIMNHFSKDHPSRKSRNGVCTKGKNAIFLISEPGSKQPNMYDFANAFRKLGCTDALYLDGTISKLVLNKEAVGWERRYAGFFVFQ